MADVWGGSWGDAWGESWGITVISGVATISATDVEVPLPVDYQIAEQPPAIPGRRTVEGSGGQRRTDAVATPGSRMQRGRGGFTTRTGSFRDVRN